MLSKYKFTVYQRYGEYQLDIPYLHGDYSRANQELAVLYLLRNKLLVSFID
ncbi:MAG: hypothetical protein H9W82_00640 [Lactobacillus sp.]|nr:hypothetical protein [Lactobacillus sp.]